MRTRKWQFCFTPKLRLKNLFPLARKFILFTENVNVCFGFKPWWKRSSPNLQIHIAHLKEGSTPHFALLLLHPQCSCKPLSKALVLLQILIFPQMPPWGHPLVISDSGFTAQCLQVLYREHKIKLWLCGTRKEPRAGNFWHSPFCKST